MRHLRHLRHLRHWWIWTIAIVVSGLAWGIAWGAGHGGNARPAAPQSTAQPRPMHSSQGEGSGHVNARERERSRDRFNRINAVAAYPWWYGVEPLNPDGSSNYPTANSANNAPNTAANNGNGSALSPPAAPFDPNAARSTMDSVRSRAQAQLDSSPQWVSANTEMNQALADLAAVKGRVQSALSARPDYQAAVDEKKAAQDLAAALHARGAGIEQIMPVAQRDLEASTTISRIEREAMANDPELLAARARLQNAVAARESLQAGLRSTIMSDPQWQEAKRALDQAR